MRGFYIIMRAGMKDLKRKLENLLIRVEYLFVKCSSKNSQPFYLSYNNKTTARVAVSKSYSLATKYSIKEITLLLHGVILRVFRESMEHSWPPTANDCDMISEVIPNQLQKLLNPCEGHKC